MLQWPNAFICHQAARKFLIRLAWTVDGSTMTLPDAEPGSSGLPNLPPHNHMLRNHEICNPIYATVTLSHFAKENHLCLCRLVSREWVPQQNQVLWWYKFSPVISVKHLPNMVKATFFTSAQLWAIVIILLFYLGNIVVHVWFGCCNLSFFSTFDTRYLQSRRSTSDILSVFFLSLTTNLLQTRSLSLSLSASNTHVHCVGADSPLNCWQ